MEAKDDAQETDDQTKIQEDEAAGPRAEEAWPVAKRLESTITDLGEPYAENGWVKRHRQEQEDKAGRRDPVAPYTIKLNLMNMQHVTINRVTVPWLDWLHSLLQWHGVSLETGFTPIGSIAHIERIVDDAPVTGGNVVLFSGGRK